MFKNIAQKTTMNSNTNTMKYKNSVKINEEEVISKISVKPSSLLVKSSEGRNSLFTELFENKYIVSVYRICLAFFVSGCISSLVHDYSHDKKILLGYNLVSKALKNMHLMVIIWLLVFFISLIPYYGAKYWAKIRHTLKRKSLEVHFWDGISLLFYITHSFGMLYCGFTLLLKCDLGFIAGISAGAETVRLMMKGYSFVRFCVTRLLDQPEKYSEHRNLTHYIYFLVAPTMLYKDSYSRSTNPIKWEKVAVYFLEFVAIIFLLSITFERVFIAELQYYGLKHMSVVDILFIITNNALYGLVFMLALHYLVLHLWLNAFAEMLSFSDRLFYKDWWSATTHQRYYRDWNLVMNEWLYTYIYTDFVERFLPKRKMMPKLAVFLVSSFFHDYVISLAIGFFMPVYIIDMVVFGVILSEIKFPNNIVSNVLLLYTIGLKASIQLTVCSLEYYCRLNRAKNNLSLRDFFVPKFVECYK
ncbi:hypothetical protein RN001_012968 [Aquatica leii]|uniref:O-acyltransferase n=1 Tax=Aquatica leii TaxID=1421715 RepID=A0AAN7P226_9COLE|nr:hypothetical protein RN001_012968 [Aquatica leii]